MDLLKSINKAKEYIKVLGISCITHMAIADNLEPLDYTKVVDTLPIEQ